MYHPWKVNVVANDMSRKSVEVLTCSCGVFDIEINMCISVWILQ